MRSIIRWKRILRLNKKYLNQISNKELDIMMREFDEYQTNNKPKYIEDDSKNGNNKIRYDNDVD